MKVSKANIGGFLDLVSSPRALEQALAVTRADSESRQRFESGEYLGARYLPEMSTSTMVLGAYHKR